MFAGYKEFYSKELKNECSVFYPILRITDRDGKNIKPIDFEETVDFMPHGDEQV